MSEKIRTVAYVSLRSLVTARPPGVPVPKCSHENSELIESVFEEFPPRDFEVRCCKACGKRFEVDL